MANLSNAKPLLQRVLVIVKETYFELVQAANDRHQLDEIAKKAPGLESVAESHAQHVATLKQVTGELRALGVDFEVVNRRHPELQAKLAVASLVITVGGDGTFLTASHDITDETPVLGVNSAPITSFGHFCVCDRHSFSATLAKVASGEFKPVKLLRLALSIDGKAVSELVLNEVLIAHEQPAGTSRYHITVAGQTEVHKCSGLLVSTPSGSTGFLRSEGGPVLAIDAQQFAYVERAPFLRLGEVHKFSRGIAARGQKLQIVSQMQGGRIYIDGDHTQHDFPRGAVLTIEAAQADLNAFVDRGCHQPYIDLEEATKLAGTGFKAWLKGLFN
ncbi:MAG: NAD(+)/NADH kinase [Candidatus Obscuribacterales bacterium]|jgi:NAD+ kinase